MAWKCQLLPTAFPSAATCVPRCRVASLASSLAPCFVQTPRTSPTLLQCGTFHPLSKFSDNRRSCRERLQKHAIRRRKAAGATARCARSDGCEEPAGPLARAGAQDVVPAGSGASRGGAAVLPEGCQTPGKRGWSLCRLITARALTCRVPRAPRPRAGSDGSEQAASRGSGAGSPPPSKRRRSSEPSARSTAPAGQAQQAGPEPMVLQVPAPHVSIKSEEGPGLLKVQPVAPPVPEPHVPEHKGQGAAAAAPSAGWQWMAAWRHPRSTTTTATLCGKQPGLQAAQPVRLGSNHASAALAAAPAAAADNPLAALAAAAEEEEVQEEVERRQHAAAQAQAAARPPQPALAFAGAAASAALLRQHAAVPQRAEQGLLGSALPHGARATMQQGQHQDPGAHFGAGSSDCLFAAASTAIAAAAAAITPAEPADMLHVLLAGSAPGQAFHPAAVAAALLAVEQEQQRRRAAAAQQLLLAALAGASGQALQLAAAGGPPLLSQQQLPPPQVLQPPPPHRHTRRTCAAPPPGAERQQGLHATPAVAGAPPPAPALEQQLQALLSAWQGRSIRASTAAGGAPMPSCLAAGPAWGGFPVTTGGLAGGPALLQGKGPMMARLGA